MKGEKKILKAILLWTIIFFSSYQTGFGYELKNTYLEKSYKKLTEKIEKQFPNNINQQLEYYKKIKRKIRALVKEKKLEKKVQEIIVDLYYLNTIQIQKIESKISQTTFLKDLRNNDTHNTINNIPISSLFTHISYNKDNLALEEDTWYTYHFPSFRYFLSGATLNEETLKHHSISPEKDLLFITEKGSIGFVEGGNYKKINLISDRYIKNIANKYEVLKSLKDDSKYSNKKDRNDIMQKIENITQKLIKNKPKEKYIEIIYSYILDNISYTENINLNTIDISQENPIFSGTETFINKDGVCEGYAKLFLYMLSFAGVEDVEVIRGQVVDANDFPSIGHAWVRIGNKYYDPTFDDPIGIIDTKKPNEFKYFALPYDLFYTNRFLYKDTPEELKSLSLLKRKIYVEEKLISLLDKYNTDEYNLLKLFNFKKKHGIDPSEPITVENLANILPMKEVKGRKFTMNGQEYYITQARYYTLSEIYIDHILEKRNFEMNGSYFFKWYINETDFEYRLGYDIVTR